MIEYSDEQILANIKSDSQRANDKALSIIYEAHYDLIANFIKKNSGSESDAADLFQDAIIVFYNQVKKKDFELSCAISTYLFSVSRNLWLKRLRTNRKMNTLSINEELVTIAVDESHLQTLIVSEEKKLIADILRRMGEECRKVILYFYFDRFKMKKIAQIMGLSNEQVAKNKKSRCMKRLVALVNENNSLKEILKK